MARQPKFNLAISRPGLLTNSKLSPNGGSVRQQKTTHHFPSWRQRCHKELFLFNFKIILFLQRWKQHDQTRTHREADKIQQEISRDGASRSQRAQKRRKKKTNQTKEKTKRSLKFKWISLKCSDILNNRAICLFFFPVLDFKAAFFLFSFHVLLFKTTSG